MDTNGLTKNDQNAERPYRGTVVGGFFVLFMMAAAGFFAATTMVGGDPVGVVIVVIVSIAIAVMFNGFMMLEPNQAIVVTFFGKYKGTFAKAGYYWINPFMSKRKLSLRIDNIDIQPIKVNDKEGNPILIGMVLVWKISDSYKAMFDVDGGGGSMMVYRSFVEIQGNAALREVAGRYAYDNDGGSNEMTLRSGGSEINALLEKKINDRLAMSGIEVVEARINYLAYAPEIAAVMLRRQQAAAIIAAREKIVEGAVTTVKMALEHLEAGDVVKLDNDRKAQMVGNLLVVLCADEAAQPVIPTA